MRKKGWGLKAIDGLPDGNGWLMAEFGGETAGRRPRSAARKAIDAQQERYV